MRDPQEEPQEQTGRRRSDREAQQILPPLRHDTAPGEDTEGRRGADRGRARRG
jgi:hypothetical protein